MPATCALQHERVVMMWRGAHVAVLVAAAFSSAWRCCFCARTFESGVNPQGWVFHVSPCVPEAEAPAHRWQMPGVSRPFASICGCFHCRRANGAVLSLREAHGAVPKRLVVERMAPLHRRAQGAVPMTKRAALLSVHAYHLQGNEAETNSLLPAPVGSWEAQRMLSQMRRGRLLTAQLSPFSWAPGRSSGC